MLRNIILSVDRRDEEVRCTTLIAIGVGIGLAIALSLVLLSTASQSAADILVKGNYLLR